MPTSQLPNLYNFLQPLHESDHHGSNKSKQGSSSSSQGNDASHDDTSHDDTSHAKEHPQTKETPHSFVKSVIDKMKASNSLSNEIVMDNNTLNNYLKYHPNNRLNENEPKAPTPLLQTAAKVIKSLHLQEATNIRQLSSHRLLTGDRFDSLGDLSLGLLSPKTALAEGRVNMVWSNFSIDFNESRKTIFNILGFYLYVVKFFHSLKRSKIALRI